MAQSRHLSYMYISMYVLMHVYCAANSVLLSGLAAMVKGRHDTQVVPALFGLSLLIAKSNHHRKKFALLLWVESTKQKTKQKVCLPMLLSFEHRCPLSDQCLIILKDLWKKCSKSFIGTCRGSGKLLLPGLIHVYCGLAWMDLGCEHLWLRQTCSRYSKDLHMRGYSV